MSRVKGFPFEFVWLFCFFRSLIKVENRGVADSLKGGRIKRLHLSKRDY